MKKVAILILAFLPILALAHPGHGIDDHGGFVHFIFSHGYLVVLAVIAISIGFFALRKSRK